jgi:hypothetical protein
MWLEGGLDAVKSSGNPMAIKRRGLQLSGRAFKLDGVHLWPAQVGWPACDWAQKFPCEQPLQFLSTFPFSNTTLSCRGGNGHLEAAAGLSRSSGGISCDFTELLDVVGVAGQSTDRPEASCLTAPPCSGRSGAPTHIPQDLDGVTRPDNGRNWGLAATHQAASALAWTCMGW